MDFCEQLDYSSLVSVYWSVDMVGWEKALPREPEGWGQSLV
jgi:hypothetical protein